MSAPFRFSHRSNRAAEIDWQPWGRAAFQAGSRRDQPVLLFLTAAWCHWCHRMDEEAFSDDAVIGLLNDRLVPVRVDTDDAPHVRDRYIAGGWPTVAFLTPTGEVLWSGTYLAADGFADVAGSVLEAWAGRRGELEAEIRRRKEALESARQGRPRPGALHREAAEDVLMALRSAFDARNGGFGNAPKFPPTDAVELLFTLAHRAADPDWGHMAEHTLDGMLAGELLDRDGGGFFRYALEADWTQPRYEKLLESNGGLVDAYALGAELRGRDDWRDAVAATVEWVETRLSRKDGLWGNSQADDPAWHGAGDRSDMMEPPVDLVAYTAPNARWVRALARAGARLGRPDWTASAVRGLDALLERMAAPGDLLHHGVAGHQPWRAGLLEDSVETARACLAVAEIAQRPELGHEALRLARGMSRHLWDEDGGFADHVQDEDSVGALAYRERPFLANAAAALLFAELAREEEDLRETAERTLAALAPVAARYGPDAALFAMAVDRLFEPAA